MARVLEAKAVISAQDKTGGTFAAVAAKMGLLSRQAAVVSRSSSMLARANAAAMAGVGNTLAAWAAPAAAAAGVVSAFKQFATFERTMTRIGVTADATREDMAAASAEIAKIATETAQPIEQVAGGLDALVTQGKSLPEAMAMIRSVAMTAQAAGAEVRDISNTAGAVADQMGITGERMQAAFDIMVAAGKAGKFELKDMARYLPSIAPKAAVVGMKGEEGLRRLVSILQVIRNQTGTAEEAGSSMANIFAKMESEETTKKFKKFGIDLRVEMEKARKSGADLFDTFVKLSDKAIKGDLSKVPQLFADEQFARGMLALLSQKGAVDKLVASLRNVDGSSMRDLARVTDDAQASIDRLSNSWGGLMRALGKGIAPAAVPMLEKITKAIDEAPAKTEESNRMAREGDIRGALTPGGLAGSEAMYRADLARIEAKIERMRAETPADIRRRASIWAPQALDGQAGKLADLQAEKDRVLGDLTWRHLSRAAADVHAMGQKLATRDLSSDFAIDKSTIQGPVLPPGYETFGNKILPTPRPDPRKPLPPSPLDLSSLKDLKATVEGPVEAKLEGTAQVNARIEVSPSSELLRIVERAKSITATGHLSPGSTGTSMPDTGTAP